MATSTMSHRFHQTYEKVGFETAGREELLLLMYANILKCLRRARKSLQKGEKTRSQVDLLTAQGGVVELLQTIDMKVAPELSKALQSLYLYLLRQLSQALRGNLVALDEAISMLADLDQTWRQALRRAA